MAKRQLQRGFTMVELIMVIVILGVISGVVAVFMKNPIDAYFATARRSGLADRADTTVRRMARDIRKALPNSLRQSISPAAPNTQCIEFIPTRMGARYRASEIAAGDDTSLQFSSADTTFNMLGVNTSLRADQRIQVNDYVAVYNLGIAGADAYAGDNTAKVTSVGASPVAPLAETKVDMAGNATRFPLESPQNRFNVIPGNETIVSYICSGGNLYRNTNYAYTSSCPAPAPGTPLISTGASCTFNYNTADIRNAVVQLTLTFTDSGETTTIYHEVHVDNTP